MNNLPFGQIETFATSNSALFAILIAKLTVLFLIALIVYRLFVQKSASFRHTVLALSLIALPLLMASQWLPMWSIGIPQLVVGKTSSKNVNPENELGSVKRDPLLRNFSPSDEENPFLQKKSASARASSQLDVPGQLVFMQSEPTDLPSGPSALPSLVSILVGAWIVGACLLLIRLAIACFVVQRTVDRASPFDDEKLVDLDVPVRQLISQLRDDNIRLKISRSATQMPLAAGFWNNTILLPENCYGWSKDFWYSVILHELGHIKRLDCWTNFLAQAQQAILWFHPFAWLMTRLIRWECEKACDDFAIHSGVKTLSYADTLLQVVSQSAVDHHFKLATVSMCEASEVESRMKSILAANATRGPVSRLAIATMLIAISISYLAIGTADVYSANRSAGPRSDVIVSSFHHGSSYDDFDLVITLNDGSKVQGTTADEIKLETAFGEILFKSQSLRRLVANDDKTFSVETADGSNLNGKIGTDNLAVKTDGGEVIVKFIDIEAVSVVCRAKPIAGTITNGCAENQLTYHVLAPEGYDPELDYPAILILHGSNSNSRDYMQTIAKTWPDIADDYLLIGINGENTTKKSKPSAPRHNYTYVNFVGKSVYEGFPGTDRESPVLVAEVIEEIKANIGISKLFVGGHSQGGFLTYSVMMNFPNLVDGAFPVSGGMIIQCDPFAYDDKDLKKLQKKTPLAIVHSPNDRQVSVQLAKFAYGAFLDDGFPMIRFFNDSDAGHHFEDLPVDNAIRWLELMTTNDAENAIAHAKRLLRDSKFRDLGALLQNVSDMELTERQSTQYSRIKNALEDQAISQSHEFVDAIIADQNGEWVEGFLKFRSQFESLEATEKAMTAFYELRAKHEPLANEIFSEARKLIKSNDETGYVLLQRIIDEYYASSKYRIAKDWLKNR